MGYSFAKDNTTIMDPTYIPDHDLDEPVEKTEEEKEREFDAECEAADDWYDTKWERE